MLLDLQWAHVNHKIVRAGTEVFAKQLRDVLVVCCCVRTCADVSSRGMYRDPLVPVGMAPTLLEVVFVCQNGSKQIQNGPTITIVKPQVALCHFSVNAFLKHFDPLFIPKWPLSYGSPNGGLPALWKHLQLQFGALLVCAR